ncbi:MAG: glycerate kinase [Ruminococcaceae bacterium]|nr:glycerate kinase [Oscillospiraceae bacterium]
MKKCIVASDSFKGTLSSREICKIARETVPRFFPDCELITTPIADGGEGTVDCFVEALNMDTVTVAVAGPFGELIEAKYAKKDRTAVIEMASAVSLPLVGDRLDPLRASTLGVGQILRHAIENGCNNILLGLGGSASNDGGCACASAMGVKFYGQDGSCFIPVGESLKQIKRIDISETKALLHGVKITVMCDVENPLYGPKGAAYVFGPQKGASKELCLELVEQLRAFNKRLEEDLGVFVADVPGSGAAGGMGAGCMAFFDAELKPGIEAVLDMVEFDHQLLGTDLVITGEGKLDSQSMDGKVISGVGKRCKAKDVPLLSIVGNIEPKVPIYEAGVSAVFSINRQAMAFEQSASYSHYNYRQTLEDILRLLSIRRS